MLVKYIYNLEQIKYKYIICAGAFEKTNNIFTVSSGDFLIKIDNRLHHTERGDFYFIHLKTGNVSWTYNDCVVTI